MEITETALKQKNKRINSSRWDVGFQQSNRTGGNVYKERLKEDFKLGALSWRYNPL